jgi:hypothetical protein
MVFFRSEELMDEWCLARGMGRDGLMSTTKLWELAQTWYHKRLDPDYMGRSLDEAVAIFTQLGFTSDFWKP